MPIYASNLLALGDGTIVAVPATDGGDGGFLYTHADGTTSFSANLTEDGSGNIAATGDVAVTGRIDNDGVMR